MNFEQYEKEFILKATKVGYTAENIERCLSYAKPLIEQKLPVIYNTSNLSALVGYRKDYLKRAVVYTPYFYRDFYIKKRNGKLRAISEPLPSLKDIQIWILQNILEKVKVSPFAKAYKKNTSIIENVRFHKKQSQLLTIDLKDFFTSIKVHSVEDIFKSLGYSNIISNLLAKLCTRDGYLPQGAPTSPYISNIYFKKIDDLISKYCLQNNIKYTRYADDLSFSGEFNEKEMTNFVINSVKDFGLEVNYEKITHMKPNQRQTVTGIVVNEKPQVVFYKRNQIRQEMYFIQKFGFDNHVSRIKIKKRNYFQHLLGKINFILHLNPQDTEFQEYKKQLKAMNQ